MDNGAALSTSSGNTSTQNLWLNADLARQTAHDEIGTVGCIHEGMSDVDGRSVTTT